MSNGYDHHMRDWQFWGDFTWLFIIGGIIILFILIIILFYTLDRGKHQISEDLQSRATIDQNTKRFSKIDSINHDMLNFCPNCGVKVDNSNIKYCTNCGWELK
ncbi:MAG: zinc ribbon domain-containing protein [Promethearchaeota archaeon]